MEIGDLRHARSHLTTEGAQPYDDKHCTKHFENAMHVHIRTKTSAARTHKATEDMKKFYKTICKMETHAISAEEPHTK